MRKYRVLDTVRERAPVGAPRGITAKEVAETLGIMRHNASADLNELVREGLVLKSSGRPVQFWAVDNVRSLSLSHGTSHQSTADSQSLSFKDMIGAKGSLRTALEQAQAAMLYPPSGLPTLITGSTGTGKSYLAQKMYQYALETGRLNSDAPFNVFNCADYAANPQLLLAQLFGYVKGAFTGADRDTPGLIEQSEGGVLFLDEIHRLPPEGQEMLFLLMDRGIYRMIGDGAVERKASVMLIAATSEDPHSTLLQTLLRRFPVMITLPNLQVRPLEERLAMVERFLRKEADRIGVPILVSPLVLIALLTFRAVGNVGELHSAVLLGCAKAFLNYIAAGEQSGVMPLYLTHLSPQIQLDYLGNDRGTMRAEKLVGVEERLFSPEEDQKVRGKNEDDVSFDLYNELRRRMRGYLESNLDQGEIQKLIQIDVEYYSQRLLRKADNTSLLTKKLLDVVSDFVKEASKELGTTFGPEMVTGLALHLASAPRTDSSDADHTLALMTHCPREYTVVRRLAGRLETGIGITLTSGEMSFLALLLAAHGREAETARLTVLVIAHGESTASSMAEVANRLLGEKHITAVDMPLDQSVETTLQKAIQRIKETRRTKGVLLLVDMGSLTGFGAAIQKETGIPVEVVPLVTTAAVIEAGRMAGEQDVDLAQMVQAVREVYNPDSAVPVRFDDKKVIVTTCLTGHGTARKLAGFLAEALPPDLREQVVVQPIDLENGSRLPHLIVEGWRGTVIAAVGTVDPHFPGVPFIGMEQILFGDGLHNLIALATGGGSEADVEGMTNQEVVELASRFVAESIDSPEGQKFASAAAETLTRLEEHLSQSVRTDQAARWVIHFGFALERLTTGGPISECQELEYLQSNHSILLETIGEVIAPVSEEWSVTFSPDEIGFLALIVLS